MGRKRTDGSFRHRREIAEGPAAVNLGFTDTSGDWGVTRALRPQGGGSELPGFPQLASSGGSGPDPEWVFRTQLSETDLRGTPE
eukprot:2443500-Prymnesium_polylepis.1